MIRCLTPILSAISLLVALPGLPARVWSATWTDQTIGLPVFESIGLRELGTGGQLNALHLDNRGRVFIGADKLVAHNGQSWLSFAVPGAQDVTSIAAGSEGKILIGATNECGYFEEPATDEFHYHSLTGLLPASERDIGTVWGCGQVGRAAYFICQKKILRWDGQQLTVIAMPTVARLGPLKSGGELWVHHLETGLHRLTETGPQLVVPASELPPLLILGLYRDNEGLVTISNQGLVRPGKNPAAFSEPALNTYLNQNRVSAFAELPGRLLAIGTLSGGLVLADQQGRLVRSWTSQQGYPGRLVTALLMDRTGNLLGLSGTNFFNFPVHARATLFNSRNGLAGLTLNHLQTWQHRLLALTEDGNYALDAALPSPALFQPQIKFTETYNHAIPHRDGLLLASFGGADFFDGRDVREVYRLPANWVFRLHRSRQNPGLVYAAEAHAIASLNENPDGTWRRELLVELPDYPTTLHEDRHGLLWIGTLTRGAFTYDSATKQLQPILNPLTGQPFGGRLTIQGTARRTLLIAQSQIFASESEKPSLTQLEEIPAFESETATPLPGSTDFLITIKRTRGSDAPSSGIGILSLPDDAPARWRELDLPALNQIGSPRTAAFSEEAGRPILWLGGSEGILRVDFADLPTLAAPAAPTLQLANRSGDFFGPAAAPHFDFNNHHVTISIQSHDYVDGKRQLVQTRFAGDNWSTPSPQRRFGFTNLSEGTYEFEARFINSANQVSPAAQLTFTIEPPWYRANITYAGGVLLIVLGTGVVIRVRERRVRERNQQLEKLVALRTEELVKANAAKDEFLASISHEIRNPMNGVIGIAETFPAATLDAASRRKFTLLRQCAAHLASLLEDILDFSRVQSGRVELESVPFSLRASLDDVIAMTAADSEKYGVPVEVAISPVLPDHLLGDPKRLRQILLNFVGNALKYSGRGRVTVTVWGKTAAGQQAEITFAISDEGPGISAEEQRKLFTRFERGAAAHEGRVPGTGLGLALCKALAGKMGGRIWVESELGQGSCFYFSATFPVATTPAAGPAPNFATALVVDDEEYNRVTLADHLTALGVATQSTADGAHALILAGSQDFDLVFLDYNLPGLDGPDVARGIRQLPNRTGRALIFATTAFSTDDKKARCLDAGMDAFIGKPITKERLQQALRQHSAARARNPAEPAEPPADPYANLRALAAKKQISFREQAGVFLAEMQSAGGELEAALAARDVAESCRLAHLLYGRCGFIHASGLETLFRQIEGTVTEGDWPRARTELQTAQTALASLARLLPSADAPIDPPASTR